MSAQNTAVIPSAARAQANAGGLAGAYSASARALYALAAVIGGVLVAGFWNAKLVDGFGRNIVASHTVGDTHALAGTFAVNGAAFGIVFAVVAGLAASFTACNCVVFAMLPGLACGTEERAARRRTALRALGLFAAGVVLIGLIYGAFIGTLGRAGAAQLNNARLPQAEIVFTVLGAVLLIWGALEFGFLRTFTAPVPGEVRSFFTSPLTRAGLMGLLVGTFAVGRPYPVFRDLLTYAATSHNPLYGALVMGLQGLGQITVMVIVFALLVWGPGRRFTNWLAERPNQASLITSIALIAGGSYFVYYWGLALAFGIGQWGFKLGIYS
ncbi:MAG TPA: hypothetical protein VOB72_21285 [Candidatus Dormibacteraeota bacterium]|nr:hypothetical protein [Candidatus Dormibacteraeota bacterium]